MDKKIVDLLFEHGINSVEELSQAEVEELLEIGLDENKAKSLIKAAKRFIEDENKEG